jgi:hypothetical protein
MKVIETRTGCMLFVICMLSHSGEKVVGETSWWGKKWVGKKVGMEKS